MTSAKRLLSTLLTVVSTRLELLANELEEEWLRQTQMLLFALSALFCFGLGILLLTVFIVVLFWDDHRLAVIGALSVAFFAAGLLIVIVLRAKAQAKSKLFSASLAEFTRDTEQLAADQDGAAPS